MSRLPLLPEKSPNLSYAASKPPLLYADKNVLRLARKHGNVLLYIVSPYSPILHLAAIARIPKRLSLQLYFKNFLFNKETRKALCPRLNAAISSQVPLFSGLAP